MQKHKIKRHGVIFKSSYFHVQEIFSENQDFEPRKTTGVRHSQKCSSNFRLQTDRNICMWMVTMTHQLATKDNAVIVPDL